MGKRKRDRSVRKKERQGWERRIERKIGERDR